MLLERQQAEDRDFLLAQLPLLSEPDVVVETEED
jgi:hypothetical protein